LYTVVPGSDAPVTPLAVASSCAALKAVDVLMGTGVGQVKVGDALFTVSVVLPDRVEAVLV
jgi:hypothetical protein